MNHKDFKEVKKMKAFIIGVSGAIGGMLADRLVADGIAVAGLVRSPEQQGDLTARGIETHLDELEEMTPEALAQAIAGSDAIVYTAGSNGGPMPVTEAIDGRAVEKAIEAASMAGVSRFILVSVLPESWRERNLGEELEHYFMVKKQADVAVTRSSLDWVILRPSLLLDDPAKHSVSMGPAEIHNEITREDVALTLVELLAEPRISRQILELDRGDTPIREAVQANVRTVVPA
jgi:uncharacterized protein YbjT (DUF2867 family)